MTSAMKSVTVVVPLYNEGEAITRNLPVIVAALEAIESFDIRLLLVDDGSTDGSSAWLRQQCEPDWLELLTLTRNFGKEAAIQAGLQHAGGDAVIVMDSDLQHPPQLIPKMLALWLEGIEIVDARKASRGDEPRLSAFFASAFYRVFGLLAQMDIRGHSDFKLLDRKVVDAYCALPERKRFFRGLIAWMGFSSAQLYFDVQERAHGASAWPRIKLFRYSVDALTGFSTGPLHLITLLGVLTFVFSVILGGIALYDKMTGVAVSGFTTVILIILIIGSCIMAGLGLIGVYLEQIFIEVKNRPIYLVDERRSKLRKTFE